jgi:hypothetical protein
LGTRLANFSICWVPKSSLVGLYKSKLRIGIYLNCPKIQILPGFMFTGFGLKFTDFGGWNRRLND